MTDTRPKALEKARQRKTEPSAQNKPPATGFESERERAKQALRDDVNTMTGQNVHKLAATVEEADSDRILRVAAYCRVSTDDIDQVISIELQKNNYRDMIKANPKWKYVGTYVDDGFSGTNTEHRPAFKLMMRDAMAGKIDMIITKSVSRFARNLLDCIGWVRKLQEHNPPIPVFFEQENLNTLASTSNIILFVLAMVAEEESHMKSEAMLLSLEWRLSRGRFLTPKLLGYDRVAVDDGHGGVRKQLVVNEDQAQTVRLMYYMLLSGSTMSEIADTLTELGRETGGRLKDGSANTRWTTNSVASVMRNERYCGDVLARKTWTPSFHDHKSIKNKGKKNKYYQPAHHEAIVTRAQWNAAQRILDGARYIASAIITLTRSITDARGYALYASTSADGQTGKVPLGTISSANTAALAYSIPEHVRLLSGGSMYLVLERMNATTDDACMLSAAGISVSYTSSTPVCKEYAYDGTAWIAIQDDDTGWITPTLLMGISLVEETASYSLAPAYRRIGKHVYVRGAVQAAVPSGGCDVFVLPEGFRPVKQQYWLMPCGGGRVTRVLARSSGEVFIEWCRNLSDGGTYTANNWHQINFDFWTE